MTAETLKKAQNEIDEMIEKCARDASLTTPDIAPIYDGIADEEGYLNSKVRVAWVLKEPYDDKDDNGNPCGGEWSLPKDCFTLDKLSKVETVIDNPVWDKIARVMFGFRYKKKCGTMPDIKSVPTMLQEIRSIAWVNISKMPNHTSSSDYWVRLAYQRYWKDVVNFQLKTYAPDVIIFGYTYPCFDCYASAVKRDDLSNEWVTCYYLGKQYLLDTYHPGRKGDDYVDAIIDALTLIEKDMRA